MDYIDIVFDGPPNPEGANSLKWKTREERASISVNGCSSQMDIGRFASSNVPAVWTVRSCWRTNCSLGDEMNGYLAEENISSTGDIVSWLQEAIAHFYPHSTYSKSLGPQTRERAARRPISGAQVRCPDYEERRAAPAGMEEDSRLCARTAGRAWNYRVQSRCERCVDGNRASCGLAGIVSR